MAEEVSGHGTVLLTGATGQIGLFAIPRLLAAGFAVTALSRGPAPDWYPQLRGLAWIRPDALRAGGAAHACFLLSAGPLDVALQALEHCPAIERAVVFSTSSVLVKAGSGDRRERRQVAQIAAGETALRARCASRGTPLCLFRPTLVYGCGLDRNVSWLARWIARWGCVPLAGRAEGLRQPVHADDLAQAAVAALASEKAVVMEAPLCGGSTLSYRAMVEAVFRASGKPARFLNLPARLLAGLGHLTQFLPGLRAVTPAMLRRESRDLVFDDGEARARLAYRPRGFTPTAADFALPPADWIRRVAGG